ncbi:MAG: ABC transporter permease [Candidatus Wallbacteria bacterium]|nr:ABC transporter permease [Candidatus Wallbacteria bacterium]
MSPHLLAALVRRDLALRYKGSVFGAAWTLLHPAALVAVYSLLFAGILRASPPGYPVFLLAGLLPWLWFAGAVTAGLGCFLGNAGLIRTASFPRALLPASVVLSHGAHFGATLALVLPLAIWHQGALSPALAALPLLALLLASFALGLVLLFGALNVFVRDVGQIATAVLRLWFFVTPIVYSASSVPARYRWVLALNPMAPIVEGFQQVLHGGVWPDPAALAPAAFISAALLLGGWSVFASLEGRFVEEL